MTDNTLIGEPKTSGRIVATIIDYGLTFAATFFYVIQVGHQNEDGSYQISGLPALVPMIFWFIYFPIVESIFNMTLGHYLLNLKVVKTNGQPIDFSASFKRHLLDPIDIFIFGIPAIISIGNTPKHQRLGDLWADTIVVKSYN